MISCTEFIPCYSELFTYLEEKYGRDEVDRFWEYLFQPDGKGIPLINFLKEEGVRGCWSYWSGTLNEEAADFTMYFSATRGYYFLNMHHCPSKGRLLELQDEIGIKPYHDYCLHCDHYRESAEKAGLKYIYNFIGTDKASCSTLIYDPNVFDGRVIADEDTLVMDRRAGDNEYFHRDFHSSMNSGVEYLGSTYGKDHVKEFLARYTKNVHRKTLEQVKDKGLKAVAEFIRHTYRKEQAEDVLAMEQADGSLTVQIAYCPAVKHLKETGRDVSEWYRYTTETIMETVAEAGGLAFVMESYDEDTGAAKYRFK